ncbi:hypothetical protein BX666DRAFT_2125791 [Dichotomocladium elegans]|nr:hypothetical protein BX666DRAFT_2125791 [Dichotomocladium elegans]
MQGSPSSDFWCFPISQTEEEMQGVLLRFDEVVDRDDFKEDDNVLFFFAEAVFAVNSRRTCLVSPKVSPPIASDPATLTPDLRVLDAMYSRGVLTSSMRSSSGFTTAQQILDFVDEVLPIVPSLERETWYFGFDILPEEVATPIFTKIEMPAVSLLPRRRNQLECC